MDYSKYKLLNRVNELGDEVIIKVLGESLGWAVIDWAFEFDFDCRVEPEFEVETILARLS